MGPFPMNSMVIRGADRSRGYRRPAVRRPVAEAAWSVVDPARRAVGIPHPRRPRPLREPSPILAACPNATLLTTWFSIGRMAEEWETPINRCRFMNDGDTVDVGRPHAGRQATAAVRQSDHPRPVRPEDQRFVVGGHLCNERACPDAGHRRAVRRRFRDGQFFGGRLVSPWAAMLDGRNLER